MNKIALKTKNLSKIYDKGRNKALNNLTLEVEQGEIFGLLGPNGAGKTTFLNILGGTVNKTSGIVEVWGFNLDENPRQVRASIGIVPQEVNLDAFFNPEDLLDLQSGLYGVKKSEKITKTILEMVSLEKNSKSYARNLSGGMKRRLLIAKAMVHQPPILVLDEPTAGVDVELRKNLWENVKKLNEIGVTIILTTHYLSEAQEMCNRIAILNKGHLIALDKTKNLIDRIKTKKITFKFKENIKNLKLNFEKVKVEKIDNTTIEVIYDKRNIDLSDILDILKKENLRILDIITEDGDLEDIFVQLTKN